VASSIALDQVTARAVSALSKLLPLVVPLLRPGGELLLMKGASVDAEVVKARSVIARFKLVRPEVVVLGSELDVDPTRIFRAFRPQG
jgi:16S rRNA (guanine527-N7)-methyltransferase